MQAYAYTHLRVLYDASMRNATCELSLTVAVVEVTQQEVSKVLLPAYSHPRQQHGLLILLVPAACDGDWMEFGVYTGGSVNKTANWRRRHCPQSCPPVYGFDTFTGGAMALHANLMREFVTARQIAVRAQCLAASSKHAH